MLTYFREVAFASESGSVGIQLSMRRSVKISIRVVFGRKSRSSYSADSSPSRLSISPVALIGSIEPRSYQNRRSPFLFGSVDLATKHSTARHDWQTGLSFLMVGSMHPLARG